MSNRASLGPVVASHTLAMYSLWYCNEHCSPGIPVLSRLVCSVLLCFNVLILCTGLQAWNLTGDSYSVNPGDKPWISEMYGYSFGCAMADVWHKVDYSAMLYPGYFTTGQLQI